MVRETGDRVGVVGAGTMGNGIAQVAATAGHDVELVDVDRTALERGFDAIDDSLGRLADRDDLEEKPDAIRRRIEGATDISDGQSHRLLIAQ